MIRWKCPDCGSGKNAPSRMRRDDVRRFCLLCSERTGRMVERVSLVRVARKQKSAAKRAVRVRRQRTHTRSKWEQDGLHMQHELFRLWRHARVLAQEWRVMLCSPQGKAPDLTVHRGGPGREHTTGRAFTGAKQKIHITVAPMADRHQVCAVLAHEVGHFLARGAKHMPIFWARLGDLVERAYGVKMPSADAGWKRQAGLEGVLRERGNDSIEQQSGGAT